MALEDKLVREFDDYKDYNINDLEPTLQHRIEVPFYSVVLSDLFGCFTDEDLKTFCTTHSIDRLMPAILYWKAQGLFDESCEDGKRGLTQKTQKLVDGILTKYGYQLFPSSPRDRYLLGTQLQRLEFIQYMNEMKTLPANLDLSQIGSLILRAAKDSVGFSPVYIKQQPTKLSIHEITEDGAKAFWLATYTNRGTISEQELDQLARIIYRELAIRSDLNVLLWYPSVDDKSVAVEVFNDVPKLYGMPDGTALEFANTLRLRKDEIKKPFVEMFDSSVTTSYNYSVPHLFSLICS